MNELPLNSERAARRSAILRSAVETFAEHGFAASRTRDIAAGAGVAEGTIYLYFDGKDDLLLTAFREKVSQFCESVSSLLSDPRPFVDRLTHFIGVQFGSIEREPALAMVLLLESRTSSKFYGETVRDVLRSYAAAVDHLLTSGVERGDLRPDIDVPLSRRMLIGALEEIEVDWLLGERSRSLSALAPRVADTFCRGLSHSSSER